VKDRYKRRQKPRPEIITTVFADMMDHFVRKQSSKGIELPRLNLSTNFLKFFTALLDISIVHLRPPVPVNVSYQSFTSALGGLFFFYLN